MTTLCRLALVLLALAMLTIGALAEPSTAEYLSWLENRRQLWVQEMKRMEAHEHGQYRQEYQRLSEQMSKAREQALALKQAQGETAASLRRQLFDNVANIEQSLELLLSEVPELAETP